MNNVFYICFRTLLVLVILFFVTKLLGKKQVSQLSLFDYVIGISIGNFAAEVTINLEAPSGLYNQVLNEIIGTDITSKANLLSLFQDLKVAKREYDQIKYALKMVKQTGYGVATPSIEDMKLDKPEIIKQGGKYGIRLKASAQSIHMMKTRITTEVTPIVGSEQQSEELVNYLLKEFEENPGKIWDSNIFGKSLYELVNEGLHNKLYRMPNDARTKIKETIERIINDGCNGLICIIL